MKRLIMAVLMAQSLIVSSTAQTLKDYPAIALDYLKNLKCFERVDVGVTAGTTGIGVDVATNIGEHIQLRAGAAIMPHFSQDLHFTVEAGDDETAGTMTAKQRFERLKERMPEFSYYDIHDEVTMSGKPTYWNLKLMIDVFPFRNKHWHLTGGLYWGTPTIGKAVNIVEDAPTLVAVGLYNHWYNRITTEDFIYLFDDLEMDYSMQQFMKETFLHYGRMGVHVGNYVEDMVDAEGNIVHKKGERYMMEPDDDGTVRAKVRVNAFKPYLGFGYGGRLMKGDDRYQVSFDCGLMFWGGTPHIYTHDGTDLSRDVEDIGGKVGSYVNFVKAFKAFPVLNVRISRRL